MVAYHRVLPTGQIELDCVFMLNWTDWNKTVFDIETVLTLNWIVWNRNFYLYTLNLALNYQKGWYAIKSHQSNIYATLAQTIEEMKTSKKTIFVRRSDCLNACNSELR